ncbi:tuberin-like isoform X2 [Homarus americanus]|uniref:tuberin-like isoform X2 n=1 Tax=Homarus americanus TaxID=6706 RepID=UPI001C4381F7|nr:tuberin-like isoform X2 [Homarus americanus]
MNKDSKPEKSFPERLKRWFKLERGNLPGSRDIRLTEELKIELSNESPVAVRIKAIRELNEVLASRKLEENGIEKLWFLVQDLLSQACQAEIRHTTLQMFITLTAGHDRLGPMRHVFFNYISDNYQLEDIKPIFDFFREVIAEGKQLEYIDEYVGPFLLKWLPGLLASPQSADALNLIIVLVKFNSAYLDEPVVTGYVKEVVLQLHKAGSEAEALLCLRVLDAVLAYSYLPSSALPTFIAALTRAISVPQLTAESWKIMRNLLGTHLGNSGLYVLCRLIQSNVDAHMVRGAIFFLTSALWGSNKVSSLNYKPAAVLPTFREAAKNGHILVIYEVALSIQKLVSKMYMELHLSSWDLVLDTLIKLFEHTVALEEGQEKQAILAVLKDILDVIEQLIDLQQFGGSSDKFFSIINLYSDLRPESSVLRLLDHLAQGVDPLRPHWLANLGTLLNQYYRHDHRPNVRTKALAVLADVYNNNRHIYGTEMIRSVVTIQMDGIEAECDVGVRTAAVNLLVHIALTQKSSVVTDLLGMLEKVVMAPYFTTGDCIQVVRESEAADIIAAISGLIRFFKKKLWELPSSHAIQAYGILLACLEHHYRNQAALEGVSRVRLKIFDMIFEMRANAKYQLGFPRTLEKAAEEEEDSVSSLIPPYSPYIVVDHKHGQRLYEAQREREQQHMDLFSPLGSMNDTSREEEEGIVTEGIVLPTVLPPTSQVEVTHLSLTQAAMIVIVAMKKEKDWGVLRMILERVPQVLLNKALILSRDGNDIDYFAAALCALVTDKSLGLPESLHNTPTKFTRSDFQSYVFPVLATLASYHMHLDPVIQQKVIKCLELGVLSRCAGPLCVSALTLCVLEMRDSMIKLLREVMLNLSKITATVQNAQPILEFLSTLLHLPKVYASFVPDQYMSIFAIAIPYTNPFKFNHYIVSLAYHVIAMWFLKCRLPFRRAFVPFIAKNLNMILPDEEAATRRRSAGANEQALRHARTRMTRSQSFCHRRLEEIVKNEPQPLLCTGRAKGDFDVKEFHNDLRETCIDLMSRYTYASCTPIPRRGAVAKMLVAGGLDQTWMVGNKIITITTSGCSQRPLRSGLCDKCIQFCSVDKSGTLPEPCTSIGTNVSRRRHRSELHRTISHEAKYKPQSKDDLHMRTVKRDCGDGLTPLVDQDDGVGWSGGGLGESSDADSVERLVYGNNVGPGAAANNVNKPEEPHLCACWCQGWAEIYIRQPTGNMSWMMRLQNKQTVVTPGSELPLHELSNLYSPASSRETGELIGSVINRRLDTFTHEDEKTEELLSQPFEEPRPRAFSGASDKTQDSDLGSQRDSSGCSSGAPSHASSDLRINSADPGDDTRGSSPLTNTSTSGENPDDPRVPVQRCHSSPEMSEGVVAGGEEMDQQPLLDPESQVLSSPSTSPGPTETTTVTTTSRPLKPKPRFESMTGGGSVGSTSPPPVPSTRVRHTSAFQTKSCGSNSSISSSSGILGSSNIEGVDDSSPRPMRRDRGHTISDMNPASRKLHLRAAAASRKNNSSKDLKGGMSPSFVFLQLYYQGSLGGGKERPLLLPTHQPEMQRAMRVLDFMRPQETHKIGVLYVGRKQTTEQEILRNSFGSLRYMLFLQGLGSVLELSSVLQDEVFLGGLDTKGNDGKLVYIWHDDVMQVVFHIATLMPTKESDPNCNGKKRHIGNNYVTIVYNESGYPYNINTIKGQFNHTVVEVVPEDHSTNSVGLLCRPELMEFVGGGSDPRLVSDTNLPILVRQLALHADLASTIWESLNRPPGNPYASNWLERMRKIRKIRQMVLSENEGQTTSMDFTDLTDQDKGDKGRGGGSGYWHQFLS